MPEPSDNNTASIFLDEADRLVCPNCADDWIEQRTVTVFDRVAGAAETAVTTVLDGRVSNHVRPSERAGNPSFSSHGVTVSFECICGAQLDMHLARAQGYTQMFWTWQPRPSDPAEATPSRSDE